MNPIRSAGVVFFSVALALLIQHPPAQGQDQGRRGNAPSEGPAVRGMVAAYVADTSITVETRRRNDQVTKTEFSIVKGKTRIELGAGVKSIVEGARVTVWADKDNAKIAARILAEPGPPTAKGKVAAYEADTSITVATPVRGGQVNKTEFSIVKGKTRIELGSGVKAIEVGAGVSVWADSDNPKNAAWILAEPEAPTIRGRVTAYQADASITVESAGREVRKSEFGIVKDKTRIELGTGVKALEVGQMVSVWADKENPKNAARIVSEAVAAPRRRGSENGQAPAAPATPSRPPEAAPEREQVLKAYRDNLPTDQKLEWYTLDWVNTLGEARERAAKENRPILFIHTNKEGDLFCSLC